MNQIGEYELHRVSGGLSHYARVRIRVTASAEVVVDPQAFAWLQEEYGPKAWEWSVCDRYLAEAMSGCRYALKHLDHPSDLPLGVEIVQIRAHPAHTPRNTVKMAACLAVWRALDTRGRCQPQLVDGVFHFRETPSQDMVDDNRSDP